MGQTITKNNSMTISIAEMIITDYIRERLAEMLAKMK